jgi:serine phosphatase RsbU (regulator of sigma subunit)/PAS domain-containing protein
VGWPAVFALLIVAGVATADVITGDRIVVVGLMIAAPLLCGQTSSPAVTRAVGIVAVSVAALAFTWNDNLATWTYWVPLTVVALGSGFAWRMATYRDRLARADHQLQAIFSTVVAAVMVRDADGHLVYANQAAADLLRMPDVDAVRAATSEDLMDHFEVYAEDGGPVSLGDLPGTRVLTGETSPPPVLVRNIVKATGEERWLLNTAHAIRPEEGAPLLAVNLIEDVTETKRAELAQRLLAAAAPHSTEAADVDATLQSIAEAAVPGFADWAGADLVEPGGGVRTVAIAHLDPDKVRLGWRLRREWPVGGDAAGGIGAVIRTGRPQLAEEVTGEMLEQTAASAEHLAVLRAIGLNSTIIVPLTAGGEVLGALSFVSSTARRFDGRDLELARDLGRQIGIAVKNAQLNEERARIAQTLQASLLPDRLPRIPGWRLTSVYRAAGTQTVVGGDFYDCVAFDGGWAVVIGDVVGKGAPAAALTALVRHTTTTMIEATGDPVAALRLLNRRLCERGAETMLLCTVAVIAIRGDHAIVSSGGHPLPLLRRGGDVRPIGHTSPLLGVYPEAEYNAVRMEIRPGDRLLLYTDGVTDAPGADERFGEQRLIESFRTLDDDVEDVAAEVLRTVDGFLTAAQGDDIAMIGLDREGPVLEPERAAPDAVPVPLPSGG